MNFENDDRCEVLICTAYPPSIRVYDNKTNLDQNIYLGRKPIPTRSPSISMELVNFSEMLEIDVKLKAGPDTLAEKTFKFIRTRKTRCMPYEAHYETGVSRRPESARNFDKAIAKLWQ